MEYKLSRVNVYETLHSLYTKRCSLAVYETLVTPIVPPQTCEAILNQDPAI